MSRTFWFYIVRKNLHSREEHNMFNLTLVSVHILEVAAVACLAG